MNDFNPGPGWREVKDPYEVQDRNHVRLYDAYNDSSTYWVREEPVALLPTEPYTVIRAKRTGSNFGQIVVLHHDGLWHSAVDTALWPAADLAGHITGFEVLSEPRAVTAKAVLDRVDVLLLTGSTGDEAAYQVRAEFGVES